MRRERSMLALALALIFVPGCAQLTRIEDKVDDVSATSHGLQRQQSVTAQEVDAIKKSLESEGITSDERRADLLSRLKDMERSMRQLEARVEDQGNLLARIQASLDLLAAGQNPNARTEAMPESTNGAAADSSGTNGGDSAPSSDQASPSPGGAAKEQGSADESAADSTSAAPNAGSTAPMR